MPNRQFYLLKEGREQRWGPVEIGDLQRGVELGAVQPETWVKDAETGAILRADQIAGLFHQGRVDSELPESPFESNYPRPQDPKHKRHLDLGDPDALRLAYWCGFFAMGLVCFGPIGMLLALRAKSMGEEDWQRAFGFAFIGSMIGAAIAIQVLN